ncbi:MAG: hypothetical protein NTW16_14950 [Bacteroidetes bacterium]|nr:hypothetical protein [Bacteroidota bacterium]
MKTKILSFAGIFLLIFCFTSSNGAENGKQLSKEGSIEVFTSPDLYPLASKWASEYCRLNPTVKITLINSTDQNIKGILSAGQGIGFVSAESFTSFADQSVWNMVVGRDVIVPVMNANNPFLDDIYRKGISPEGFSTLVNNPQKQNWGALTGSGQSIPLHLYTTNNASVVSGVDNFLNSNGYISAGIKSADKQEMISAIQLDPNAMGFCKLADIIDLSTQGLLPGLKLIPIDKNGNGKLDFMEDIYDNLQDFSRGVWIGKYPKALSGNIYSVSSSKPENATEVAFLKWVLMDGQEFLNMNGFSDLVYNERQSQIDKISDNTIYAAMPPEDSFALLKVVLLVIVIFGALGYMVDLTVRRFRNKKEILPAAPGKSPVVFDENSVIIPKGVYFDKTHTWTFMKNTDKKIKKGELLLTLIQNGKKLSIYSPVTGTVIASNKTLITNSSAINTSPYTEGWVYSIEPTNWLCELQFLTMSEKYKLWLKDEFARLKDFFALQTLAHNSDFATVALQDGGTLQENVLADLGPEVWDDFQTKFIDKMR